MGCGFGEEGPPSSPLGSARQILGNAQSVGELHADIKVHLPQTLSLQESIASRSGSSVSAAMEMEQHIATAQLQPSPSSARSSAEDALERLDQLEQQLRQVTNSKDKMFANL